MLLWEELIAYMLISHDIVLYIDCLAASFIMVRMKPKGDI